MIRPLSRGRTGPAFAARVGVERLKGLHDDTHALHQTASQYGLKEARLSLDAVGDGGTFHATFDDGMIATGSYSYAPRMFRDFLNCPSLLTFTVPRALFDMGSIRSRNSVPPGFPLRDQPARFGAWYGVAITDHATGADLVQFTRG